MNKHSQLTEAFRQLSRASTTKNVLTPAEVVEVFEHYCTVRFLDSDLEVEEIRLKASLTSLNEEENYLIQYPKVGSKVLVGLLDEDYEGVVLCCDEVERVVYKKGETEVVLSDQIQLQAKDTFLIKNQQHNFQTLLLELSALVKGLKVSTGVGPSGVPLPDTLSKIDVWENKIKQLFKA